jgi:uncharacterized protein YecE (DUF72 family)
MVRQAGRRDFVYTVKVCELITHVKRFAARSLLGNHILRSLLEGNLLSRLLDLDLVVAL